MKRIKLKYIFYTFFVLLAVVLLTFILLFQRNIRTAASVRKLEDGLYYMEYKGDYNLDGFLEQGGASDDLAVAEFVIQDVFHGLLPIDLRGGSDDPGQSGIPAGYRETGSDHDNGGALTA